MTFPKRLYRYGAPGKYDQVPRGTEIIRIKSKLYCYETYYIQSSPTTETPVWEEVECTATSIACLNDK